LINTLVRAEDNFGEPLPQASVVIDNRITKVFKRELAQSLDGIIYTLVAIFYLVE
jgi:hypothetical protein